jgi:hypothetical protein
MDPPNFIIYKLHSRINDIRLMLSPIYLNMSEDGQKKGQNM